MIYLAFNQDPTVEAFHVRLVTLGLGLGVTITAAGAAWTVWRGSRLAATWCVAAASVMLISAALVTLSPNLQANGLLGLWVPLALSIAGAAAAISAARHMLRGAASASYPAAPVTATDTAPATAPAMRVAALVLAFVGLITLVRTGLHVTDVSTTADAERLRATVVILDTGESVGLIGAGLASLRGLRRATLVFAVMAASLLVVDAFVNVFAAEPGPAFVAAAFYLIVGEIPSIVLTVIAARAALRAVFPIGDPPAAPVGGQSDAVGVD